MTGLSRKGRAGLLAACFLCMLWMPLTVFGYGGGGDGGDSVTDSADQGPNPIEPLSRDQLEAIFSKLGDKELANTLVNSLVGKSINKRQLLAIRQSIFEAEQHAANRNAAIWEGLVVTVETLDTVGSYTQTVLAFVPGVGLVTSTALGAARASADAYKDGKSGMDIVKSGAFNAVANVTISKLSPLKADQLFNKASRAGKLALSGSTAMVQKGGIKIFATSGSKYVAGKYAEKVASDTMEATLNAVANNKGPKMATNYAPQPQQMHSPNYLGVDQKGFQTLYK